MLLDLVEIDTLKRGMRLIIGLSKRGSKHYKENAAIVQDAIKHIFDLQNSREIGDATATRIFVKMTPKKLDMGYNALISLKDEIRNRGYLGGRLKLFRLSAKLKLLDKVSKIIKKVEDSAYS